VALRVEELPIAATLGQQPDLAPFMCHRIYDLSPLRLAGLRVPNTPIVEGLAQHVRSMS